MIRTRRKRSRGILAVAVFAVAATMAALSAGAGAVSSPSASVSPSAAAGGESITISGKDFQAGETVSVEFGGTTIGTATADSNGSFSVTGTVPPSIPPAFHPMDVNGSNGSSVTISYEVLAPPAPQPTSPTTATGGGGGGSSTTASSSTSTTVVADASDDSAAADADESGDSFPWIWWVLIVAIVLGLAASGFWLVAGRRSRDKTDGETPDSSDQS